MIASHIATISVANRGPADAARRREQLFELASQAAYRAVLAISQEDEQQARKAVDELRFLKQLINGGEPLQSGPDALGDVPTLSVQRMMLANDTIRHADALIHSWKQQNQSSLHEDDALPDDVFWQRLIDVSLPDMWNFECDLFVVHGSPQPGLLDALRQRGQRRMMVLTSVTSPCSDEPVMDAAPGLFFGNDPAAVASFIAQLAQPYPKTFTSIRARAGQRLADTGFEPPSSSEAALNEHVRKGILNNWMGHNTRRFFAQHWVQQGVANLPAIARHQNLHALDGKFRGRPAILIAPGPSLKKNMEWLRLAKDKAILIAPLQSLRLLHKAGIKPDFVTVIDASDLTVEPVDFFGDVPDDFLTSLIVGVNCHPNVIARFKQVFFLSAGGPLDKWTQDIVGEPLVTIEAATVALTNLLLAHHWECNPIVLTGQDLALSGQTRYADDHLVALQSSPSLMTLPGYFGGTVQSPSDYFLFHHYFELAAEQIAFSSPATKLYNCTEGGAFIEGFAHEPLQQTLDLHVVNLPRAPISDVGDAGVRHDTGRLSAIGQRLNQTLLILKDLNRQAHNLQRLSRQPKPTAAMLRKLSDLEHALRAQLRNVQGFTSVYQDDIDQAIALAARARNLQENLAASRVLYQVVVDGCAFFQPRVQQALEALVGTEERLEAA